MSPPGADEPVAEATPYAPQPWIPSECPPALIGRPAEVVTAIIADIRKGKPISRIIRGHSVSSKVIRAAAQQLGWQPRAAEQVADDEADRLRKRYGAGDSIHAIARAFDIHHKQVPAVLRVRGWYDASCSERDRTLRERRAQAVSARSRKHPSGKRAKANRWWRRPRTSGSQSAPNRTSYETAQQANELWQRGQPLGDIATQIGVTRRYLEWVIQLYRRVNPAWFHPRTVVRRRRGK